MPMRYGEKLSQTMPIVAGLTSRTISAAASASTDVIDMAYWNRVLVQFNMGDYAAGNDGSVTVIVYGDTASNGSFATAITGKNITPANFTGSTNDSSYAQINVSADEVAAQNLRYIKVTVTPTNQNLTCGVICNGVHSDYQPGSDYDLAAVKQIVS